jgi:MoaA/NifB/PqqE/SkfB family radical SAM enzyme
MSSKYWDDFDRRIQETVNCIKTGKTVPIRRLAVFITNKCNFKCAYCNVNQDKNELSIEQFDNLVQRYGQTAIIHITGGEPSTVKWLYKYIDSTPDVRFHLNSNLLLTPPRNIKRLKVSLDSKNEKYFNSLVGFPGAFNRVVSNIKRASSYVVASITYTLTRENYKDAPEFMRWCRKEFPDLYAVFFSVYKGNNPRFAFTKDVAGDFFNNIKPKLQTEMDLESLSLLNETIDEKFRIMQGVRFPENRQNIPCYISMSERVVDWFNNIYNCSHLYRDNITQRGNNKCQKCLYGCNRRLVSFNEEVEKRLRRQDG